MLVVALVTVRGVDGDSTNGHLCPVCVRCGHHARSVRYDAILFLLSQLIISTVQGVGLLRQDLNVGGDYKGHLWMGCGEIFPIVSLLK